MHSCDITTVKELYLPSQKLTTKKSFNDAEALQIIDYVQGYPYMFNHKMMEHQDRQLLQMQWRTLGALLNATAEEVQAKFRNLRTQYYREKKKEAESLKDGSGAIYTSKWKFFSAMTFLDTVLTSEDTDTSLHNGNSAGIEEDEDAHSHLLECSSAASSVMSLTDTPNSEMGGSQHDHRPTNIRVMKDTASRRLDTDSDEQAFAHMVAVELQREKNDTERRRKKAAICQILFT